MVRPVAARPAQAHPTGRRVSVFLIALALVTPLPLAVNPLEASQAQAQGVRGTVREEESGRAVGGAFVSVFDDDGERVAGALTDREGGFLIHLSHPGTFRLRADRIGFHPTESLELVVPPGRLVTADLDAPARPIVIEGVEVAGSRRCDVRPEAGRQTAVLWEEARKALEIALWTEEGDHFVYDSESWVRRYDVRGRRLESERLERRTHVGRHAFRALPPGELAEHGFVQGSVEDGRSFFAPDAGVLLSDTFLDTHCFHVVAGRDGRTGLAFRPVEGRTQPEVHGTLWFAEGSAHLEDLDYGYLNAEHADDPRFGGRVHFEPLPSGAWIVREWEIRMPVLVRRRAATGEWRLAIEGVEAAGGRVVEARDLVAPSLGRGDSGQAGTIRGIAMDSTTGRPLEGATVRLSGTNRSARTDAFGDFEIPALAPGAYTLLVDHPRLSELAISSPTTAVEVGAGAVAMARLEIPSARGLVADACRRVGGAPPAAGEAGVGGVIRSGGGGEEDREMVVEVRWGTGEGRAEVVPDRWGRWGLCTVPSGVTVRVQLRSGRDAAPPVIVGRLGAEEFRWLVLDPGPPS